MQGCSVHTQRKEFEIEGLTSMRMLQFKNKYFNYKKIIIADVFSGTGFNTVNQTQIDGSPIKLIKGFNDATSRGKPFDKEVHFWFSDIREDSCTALNGNVNQAIKELPNNNLCGKVKIEKMTASDAINKLGNALYRNQDCYMFLLLDPNGPKDFPIKELRDLINMYSKRIDVIPYISATAINRCIGARTNAKTQFNSWLGDIENFDQGFVQSLISNKRQGWIRTPNQCDNQNWTMIPTFGKSPPHSDWNKQGYVEIGTEDSNNAIEYYCGKRN